MRSRIIVLKVVEFALNLTPFDKSSHDFQEFLNMLDSRKGPSQPRRDYSPFECLEFEKTLQSVEFPSLEERHAEAEIFGRTIARNEVARVLGWLRKEKSVEKIITLNVRDSIYHPHSEEIIEQALSHFDIERLNWRRLDLSVDSISCAAPNVRELHLYSSGSQAALRHWIGNDGVRKLKKVGRFFILSLHHT